MPPTIAPLMQPPAFASPGKANVMAATQKRPGIKNAFFMNPPCSGFETVDVHVGSARGHIFIFGRGSQTPSALAEPERTLDSRAFPALRKTARIDALTVTGP